MHAPGGTPSRPTGDCWPGGGTTIEPLSRDSPPSDRTRPTFEGPATDPVKLQRGRRRTTHGAGSPVPDDFGLPASGSPYGHWPTVLRIPTSWWDNCTDTKLRSRRHGLGGPKGSARSYRCIAGAAPVRTGTGPATAAWRPPLSVCQTGRVKRVASSRAALEVCGRGRSGIIRGLGDSVLALIDETERQR